MNGASHELLQYWLNEKGPDTALWSDKHQDRYLTFETDCGGLNNIRMAFECVVSIAVFSGRTLVLPPPEPWVFIDFDYQSEPGHITRSHLAQVFDIEALSEFVPVVTAGDFVDQHGDELGMPGPVIEYARDDAPVPRRDFKPWEPSPWGRWLREHARVAPWNPVNTLLCHPDIRRVANSGRALDPEFVQGRTLVEYDDQMRSSPLLHFPANHQGGHRSFGQAINMAAFAYPELARMHRRLIKRAVRYGPGIFSAASRLIEQLGPYAYSALHIRRNDFASQFGAAGAQSPEQTRARIAGILPAGEPLYVATDETDPAHLAPLADDRRIITWSDLHGGGDGAGTVASGAIRDIRTGPVEQLICTAARRFIGTRYSTFSMYIDRLRAFTGAPDPAVHHHTGCGPESAPGRVRSGRDWSTEYVDLWRQC